MDLTLDVVPSTPKRLAERVQDKERRRSSTSSNSSDQNAVVQPFDNATIPPNIQESISSSIEFTHVLKTEVNNDDSRIATSSLLSMLPSENTTTKPVIIAPSSAFTFEEVMSPRHQPNGKRYLGGYLLHRVSMAGGFLKSYKRKYFRLRDHGIMCFKHDDDTSALFEILFQEQSVLQIGEHESPHTSVRNGSHVTPLTAIPKNTKMSGSLVFILHNVVIKGNQVPSAKVDVPIYLKAENEHDLMAWIENLRQKLNIHKHISLQRAVNGIHSDSDHPIENEPHRTDELSHRVSDVSSINADGALGRRGSVDPSSSVRNASDVDATVVVDSPEFSHFRSKYLLLKEIGEGSFSIVHRAVNQVTGALCAVKCCKHSRALEEEISLLRKLKHPNVIGLEDVYVENTTYYVVMDYMQDGDVCERLIAKQQLSESETREIICQVLNALAYLHQHNVVHRDVKPENILRHGSLVKLADLGLAKQLPNAASMLKRSCGTLEYAAPELLCGQAYGIKSDIFSLGVVMYVLLFGRFPFTLESAAALQRLQGFSEDTDVRDMSCLDPENDQWKTVSPAAQDALERMLCRTDKDRISSQELLLHPWFVSTTNVSLDVPFHESIRVTDCQTIGFRELLSRGLEASKYTKDGLAAQTTPHLTTIVIDFVCNSLSWTPRPSIFGVGGSGKSLSERTNSRSNRSRNKNRVILFSDIVEIRCGHATEAFQVSRVKQDIGLSSNSRTPPHSTLCLSIVSSWRTLDLAMKVPSQRTFLYNGLNRELEKFRQTKQ